MYKKIIDGKSKNLIGYIDNDKIYKDSLPLEDTTFKDAGLNSVFGSMINMGKFFVNTSKATKNFMGKVGSCGKPPYDNIIKDKDIAVATIKNDCCYDRNGNLICKVEFGTALEIYTILNLFYQNALVNKEPEIKTVEKEIKKQNVFDGDDWYAKAQIAKNKYHCSISGDNINEMILYEGTDETTATVPPFIDTIKSTAFWKQEQLTNIVLPKGLLTIEEDAFFGCRNLVKLIIPITIKNIDNYAFRGIGKNCIICFEGKKENYTFDFNKNCQGLIVLFNYNNGDENKKDIEQYRFSEQKTEIIQKVKVGTKTALDGQDVINSFVNTCNSNGINIDSTDIKEAIAIVGNTNKNDIKMQAMIIKIHKLFTIKEFFESFKMLQKLGDLQYKMEEYEKSILVYFGINKLLLTGMCMYSNQYGKNIQEKERIYLYPQILKPIKNCLDNLQANENYISNNFLKSIYVTELNTYLPFQYFNDKEYLKLLLKAMKNPDEKFYID